MWCFVIFKVFLWKYIKIIGLKAPGNYSDQFRFNKISVLLCEGPKPNISKMFGFLTLGPLIYGFKYTKILKYFKYEKYGKISENREPIFEKNEKSMYRTLKFQMLNLLRFRHFKISKLFRTKN